MSLNAGEGDDTVILSQREGGSLEGGEGNDSISMSQFDDSNNVFIDMNMDKILISDINGNIDSNSLVRNFEGFENIIGGLGDDTIVGNEHDDTSLVLRGNDGNDHIVGGLGDDIIEGGEGNDYLIGAGGSNTFVVAPNEGVDTIVDFKSGDRLVFNEFGINFGANGTLPSEITISESEDPTNQKDWLLTISKSTANGMLSSSVLFLGLREVYASVEAFESFLASSMDFTETLDLSAIDPLQSEFELDINPLSIINDLHERNDLFGDILNLENSFDDITNALGVIADAKYEQALIVSDTVSSINNVQGFSDALLSDYRGISGTEGNDVLVALDEDSVLYGGDGGHDRLIGGEGNDILISRGEVEYINNDSIGEQLSGGAGMDMFAMINPSEINDTLEAIYREVHITDFNRDEGDRVLLMGYDENAEVILSDVNTETNIQTATIQDSNSDSLTIYFDLSFAREFDTNFALRMADFDKVDAT